jgi:transcriptional regulator with XRE-family HTH domain
VQKKWSTLHTKELLVCRQTPAIEAVSYPEKMGGQLARGVEKEAVVSARLRSARVAAGLSQRELGIRAGMDPSVASPRVNQYERGKHMPDTNTLGKLGQVLDLPMAYFFAHDEELAILIARFHRLPASERRRVMTLLAKSAKSSE